MTLPPRYLRILGGLLSLVALFAFGALAAPNSHNLGDADKLNRNVQIITADLTLNIHDTETTVISNAVDLTVTLPLCSGKPGLIFSVIVETVSTTTGVSVNPQAADEIRGGGLTSVANKDLINTAASDAEGDSVQLLCDGIDSWYILALDGTWAKEA